MLLLNFVTVSLSLSDCVTVPLYLLSTVALCLCATVLPLLLGTPLCYCLFNFSIGSLSLCPTMHTSTVPVQLWPLCDRASPPLCLCDTLAVAVCYCATVFFCASVPQCHCSIFLKFVSGKRVVCSGDSLWYPNAIKIVLP